MKRQIYSLTIIRWYHVPRLNLWSGAPKDFAEKKIVTGIPRLRMVTDYKKLNNSLTNHRWAPPVLGGRRRVLSRGQFKSCYHQIALTEEASEHFTFIVSGARGNEDTAGPELPKDATSLATSLQSPWWRHQSRGQQSCASSKLGALPEKGGGSIQGQERKWNLHVRNKIDEDGRGPSYRQRFKDCCRKN